MPSRVPDMFREVEQLTPSPGLKDRILTTQSNKVDPAQHHRNRLVSAVLAFVFAGLGLVLALRALPGDQTRGRGEPQSGDDSEVTAPASPFDPSGPPEPSPAPSPIGPSVTLASGGTWSLSVQDTSVGFWVVLQADDRDIRTLVGLERPTCAFSAILLDRQELRYVWGGTVAFHVHEVRFGLRDGEVIIAETSPLPGDFRETGYRWLALPLSPGDDVVRIEGIRFDGSALPQADCSGPGNS